MVANHLPRSKTREQGAEGRLPIDNVAGLNVTAMPYLLYDKGMFAQGGASVVAIFSKSTPHIYCDMFFKYHNM